jgi:hypothetical protein
MERPGFNPQALAHSLGCQRSGANKEKNSAQCSWGRSGAAAEVSKDRLSARDLHGSGTVIHLMLTT